MIKRLDRLENNQLGIVKSIDTADGLRLRLESLGLRPGVTVRKVSDVGPVVVAVGNSQVALGKGMAEHVSVETKKCMVLLFGNPNVGKSVVFSRLTGMDVISANYAGTTVEYMKGSLMVDGLSVELIDIPGAYTLEPTCVAEEVAKHFYETGEADVLVNVVDATNLERNLYLTLQLLERKLPLIVVLNKCDSARHKGIHIDIPRLSAMLGVPVIQLVAVTGEGLKGLRETLAKAIQGGFAPPDFKPIDHQERWHIIGHISQEVQKVVHKHPSFLERLEVASVRLHSGIILAVMVLAISFMGIRVLGEGLISHVLDPFFNQVYGPAVRFLVEKFFPFPFLQQLLLGTKAGFMESFGVLTTGVYIPLAIVLPYIIAFYFILGLWEDIGYLPRLAVLSDRVMHRLGLHGHAIIPLVLSCGCKVPGVLSLRLLESQRERFIGLVLLLMAAPCIPQTAMIVSLLSPFGARYVALVFIALTGVALINSLVLNVMVKGKSPEMILEIPNYQIPHAATLLRKLWLRLKDFLLEAAPIIMLGVFVINVLEMLGVLNLLGRVARPLVVTVLGLPEEAISIILLGFLRKDVSIALLTPLHLSAQQAVTASVFLVLYLPCLATFFVALKESSWRIVLKVLSITITCATLVGALLHVIL